MDTGTVKISAGEIHADLMNALCQPKSDECQEQEFTEYCDNDYDSFVPDLETPRKPVPLDEVIGTVNCIEKTTRRTHSRVRDIDDARQETAAMLATLDRETRAMREKLAEIEKIQRDLHSVCTAILHVLSAN